MLPKTSKIGKDRFEKALLGSKAFSTPLFTLRYSKKTLLDKGFFSVVVSKAVSKKAVARNKIRRRIYSIIKKHEKTIQNKGFFMFFTKKGIENKDFKEVEMEILNVFQKI